MAKILIIGGGVSGLSAGIFARLQGHHAIICEKHDIPGGNLTGWQRKGYHIDNCIHWLTGTNPTTQTYRLWETLGALGQQVPIRQNETLYTCEVAGRRLSLYRDLSRTEDEMLAISPRDAEEIRALMRAVRMMQGICGIGGDTHDQKTLSGQSIMLIPTLLKYHRLTTGQLSARFSHPLLKAFAGSFMGEDFGALALLFVFAHFCGNNGDLPEGGSRAMAERMAARFVALGGELRLKKEAVRIHRNGAYAHRVTFSDGSEETADYLVLTSDPAMIFPERLDAPMPHQLAKYYRRSDMPRFSSFQCAFGCALEAPPFRGDFILPLPPHMSEALTMPQIVLREFSHEKSFAPEGHSLIQALIFCHEAEARAWIRLRKEDKAAYQAQKAALAEKICALITQHFPETQGKLSCIDCWTPATYRRYTNAEVGSYMSFLLPSKTLPIRTDNRIKGLKNVFLATQWQQAPGGLPIAAEGGRRAIEAIAKQEARLHRSIKMHRSKKAAPVGARQT